MTRRSPPATVDTRARVPRRRSWSLRSLPAPTAVTAAGASRAGARACAGAYSQADAAREHMPIRCLLEQCAAPRTGCRACARATSSRAPRAASRATWCAATTSITRARAARPRRRARAAPATGAADRRDDRLRDGPAATPAARCAAGWARRPPADPPQPGMRDVGVGIAAARRSRPQHPARRDRRARRSAARTARGRRRAPRSR